MSVQRGTQLIPTCRENSPGELIERCRDLCESRPRVSLIASDLLILLLLIGCSPSPSPSGGELKNGSPTGISPDSGVSGATDTVAKFVDMTPGCGVDFSYRNGEEAGHFAILESLGGGIGMIDYDLDGDIDLFVPGGGGFSPSGDVIGRTCAVFRNEGGWHFTDRAAEAGVAGAYRYTHGAAVADLNNDGFSDVIVTGYGGLRLLMNSGDGTWAETTQESGLTDTLWSSSAACGDLNGDGNPDLYVAHYVNWSPQNNPRCEGPNPADQDVCPPRRFEPLTDTLYVSSGDGTFQDLSARMAVRSDGKGLAVQIADVDLDGYPDVYVANDTVPNFLYRNTGQGTLEDVSTRSGSSLSDAGTPDGSMGVDVGDFNLDGRPDIWVANYERESFALYRNEGNCFFQHVSRPTGVTAVGGLAVGWGSVFLDFDRDGDEDVFVSNGHVIRYPTNAPLRQPPLLFQNEHGTRFRNVAPAAGKYMTESHMGRGVACGDLDNDGDQDLAVSRVNEPVTLLSNESGTHRSLVVRVIGTSSSRDAVGTVIRARVTAGAPEMLRLIKAGGSYASSSDSRQFFGTGSSPTVAEVSVRWPSGTTSTLTAVPVNVPLVLREP